MRMTALVYKTEIEELTKDLIEKYVLEKTPGYVIVDRPVFDKAGNCTVLMDTADVAKKMKVLDFHAAKGRTKHSNVYAAIRMYLADRSATGSEIIEHVARKCDIDPLVANSRWQYFKQSGGAVCVDDSLGPRKKLYALPHEKGSIGERMEKK